MIRNGGPHYSDLEPSMLVRLAAIPGEVVRAGREQPGRVAASALLGYFSLFGAMVTGELAATHTVAIVESVQSSTLLGGKAPSQQEMDAQWTSVAEPGPDGPAALSHFAETAGNIAAHDEAIALAMSGITVFSAGVTGAAVIATSAVASGIRRPEDQ